MPTRSTKETDDDSDYRGPCNNDTKGIYKDPAIANLGALNVAACKASSLQLRYVMEAHLISVDNLWMWARAYCERVKTSTDDSEPGFPEGEPVKIQPNSKTNGVGGPNKLPRAPGLKQPEVFFRVKTSCWPSFPMGILGMSLCRSNL